MELEEMKNTWQAMSERIEQQEFLTDQLLEKMTREKYHSRLNKMGYSEYAGAIICYIGAVYLLINLTKIDNTLILVLAIVAIALLFLLPLISLQSLRAIRHINTSSNTYLEAIADFGKRKIKFQKLQKLNISLGLFLMLVSIPVLAAIQGKDIARIPGFWTVIFPIAIVCFLAFAFWVLRSYNKILRDTEKMLSDINS